MTALLAVDDLRVRFGDVDALRGVGFTLQRGESLAIVGESGAGKSTLVRCLAGLIGPPQASGSIRCNGHEIVGASDDELRALRWETVAVALQGAPLNPVATAAAQIAEPLRARRGMDSAAAGRRARELAVETRFDPDLLERHPHELSGGERRRATLAMVLALDPDLVVLDEPTAGVDPAARSDLLTGIGKLAAARGVELRPQSVDLPTLFGRTQKGVDDIALTLYPGPGGTSPAADPDTLRTFFSSRIRSRLQGALGWVDEEIDELAERQLVTADHADRQRMLARMQAIVARDLPALALYCPDVSHVFRRRVLDRWYVTPGGFAGGLPGVLNKHVLVTGRRTGLAIRRLEA